MPEPVAGRSTETIRDVLCLTLLREAHGQDLLNPLLHPPPDHPCPSRVLRAHWESPSLCKYVAVPAVLPLPAVLSSEGWGQVTVYLKGPFIESAHVKQTWIGTPPPPPWMSF